MNYSLSTYLSKGIGTAGATVVALGTNNTAEINSLFVCNTDGGTVNVSVVISSDAIDYYMVKDIALPSGSSLEIVNGSKLFLGKGSSIKVSSSTDNSLDAVISARVYF
jgi:hypothetical protein